MIAVRKYKGSSLPMGATKTGLPSRGIWSDFIELTKEDRREGHEKE